MTLDNSFLALSDILSSTPSHPLPLFPSPTHPLPLILSLSSPPPLIPSLSSPPSLPLPHSSPPSHPLPPPSYPSLPLPAVALLIGLSASRRGSADPLLSKTLCLHIPTLLPAQHWDIDISPQVTMMTSPTHLIFYLHSTHYPHFIYYPHWLYYPLFTSPPPPSHCTHIHTQFYITPPSHFTPPPSIYTPPGPNRCSLWSRPSLPRVRPPAHHGVPPRRIGTQVSDRPNRTKPPTHLGAVDITPPPPPPSYITPPTLMSYINLILIY